MVYSMLRRTLELGGSATWSAGGWLVRQRHGEEQRHVHRQRRGQRHQRRRRQHHHQQRHVHEARRKYPGGLAGATVAADIGGAAPGEYGRIVATGVATLAGSLQATLVPGYPREVFTRFDVVSGSSVDGTFDNVSPPSVPAPEPAVGDALPAQPRPARVHLDLGTTGSTTSSRPRS